jgi:hypothetical protein
MNFFFFFVSPVADTHRQDVTWTIERIQQCYGHDCDDSDDRITTTLCARLKINTRVLARTRYPQLGRQVTAPQTDETCAILSLLTDIDKRGISSEVY